MKNVVAIILAAGKGTRINASRQRNKVTYELAGKPMIAYPLMNLKLAGIDQIIAVVGFARKSVETVLGQKVAYAVQRKRLGTAHALAIGLKKVPRSTRFIISLYGDDSAFYLPETFKKLLAWHVSDQAAVTVLTIKKYDPQGLGRIIRDRQGNFVAIVEEKNATIKQKKITEINTGLYCFDASFLRRSLKKIKKNSLSGEYYLTDIVALAQTAGLKVTARFLDDQSIWHGVNTAVEWQKANQKMKDLTAQLVPK